jgi:antitoxin (DNA-binding transcriptional repressor) of toxin-antitoxin stability system
MRRGERIRILVRGVPVAGLGPVEAASGTQDDESRRLAALEKAGVIRRGKGGLERTLLKPGPRARGRAGSEELIAERRSGW